MVVVSKVEKHFRNKSEYFTKVLKVPQNVPYSTLPEVPRLGVLARLAKKMTSH